MAAKKPAQPKAPSTPKRLGRPPAVIDIVQLEKLGALQPTVEETAAFFGVTKRTMIDKLKDEALAEAFERGKHAGRLNLRRVQLRHAEGTGSGAVNMAIHLGKHWLGQTDKSLLELTGKNGGPIQTFDYSKLTDEQLAQLEPILAGLAASRGDAGGDQGGAASPAG